MSLSTFFMGTSFKSVCGSAPRQHFNLTKVDAMALRQSFQQKRNSKTELEDLNRLSQCDFNRLSQPILIGIPLLTAQRFPLPRHPRCTSGQKSGALPLKRGGAVSRRFGPALPALGCARTWIEWADLGLYILTIFHLKNEWWAVCAEFEPELDRRLSRALEALPCGRKPTRHGGVSDEQLGDV